MKTILFQSADSWTPVILRVILGLVVFAHGAQKLFGWFGGYGFSGTMGFFTDTVGLPWSVALAVILLEGIGSIALIAGIGTRLLAVAFTVLAIGIVLTSHIGNGFFMNWFGNQAGEGYEYFVLWIGMSASLIISGAGKFSVDRDLIARVPASK